MIKRTMDELTRYDAPGHYGMTAMRIHGKDETKAEKFWIGLSTFLPGGGAEYAYEDNPLEKVYFVLEGEISVTDKEGNEIIVKENETISFQPYEGRFLENKSNYPARILVIINYANLLRKE